MASSAPQVDTRPKRVVHRVVGVLSFFNRGMHYIAGIVMVALLALTVTDITGRTLFNNPLPGTVEVTELAIVAVVFLGLAHSEHLRDHITVDLLYTRLGVTAKRVLNLVTRLISLVVMTLVTLQLIEFARRQEAGNFTTPTLKWAIWPVVLIAAAGSILYVLAIVANIALGLLGIEEEEEAEGGEEETQAF